MARTTRKYLTEGNYREARKGSWGSRSGVRWDASTDLPWGRRNNRGGMLMSPSSSGIWRDELPGTSRRQVKRSERQGWKQEVLDILAGGL